MPFGAGVIINIGIVKVNSISGAGTVNIGDNFAVSEGPAKNFTGTLGYGDGSLIPSPSPQIINDPDVFDNNLKRPFSLI